MAGACSLLVLVALGCAKFTLATEVVHNSDGKDTGRVVLNIRVDDSVAQAVEDVTGEPAASMWDKLSGRANATGWQVNASGRQVTLTRTYSSLEELNAAGGHVAAVLEGDSNDFIRDLKVTADTSEPDRVVYSFSAVAQVPGIGGDIPKASEPMVIPFLVDDAALQHTPEMQQKLEKLDAAIAGAGPPEIHYAVALPGEILLRSVSEGGVVRGNTIWWNFGTEVQAEKPLEVSSVWLPGSESAADGSAFDGLIGAFDTIEDAGEETSGQLAERIAKNPGLRMAANKKEVMDAIARLDEAFLKQFGSEKDHPEYFGPVRELLAEAAGFAAFENAGGELVYPSVARMLPAMARLAAAASNDYDSYQAFMDWLDRLASQDDERRPK
jgi:hypothetical protein